MSAYEELVERCENMVAEWLNIDNPPGDDPIDLAKAIIAEVRRTLETVTPEMDAAWDLPNSQVDEDLMNNAWLDMLRASALTPPKDKP